jgi:hypothetical protein
MSDETPSLTWNRKWVSGLQGCWKIEQKHPAHHNFRYVIYYNTIVFYSWNPQPREQRRATNCTFQSYSTLRSTTRVLYMYFNAFVCATMKVQHKCD